MDSKQALPFILGVAAAGLMGTILGAQLPSFGPSSPSPDVSTMGSPSQKTQETGSSVKLSRTTSLVPPQVPSAKVGNVDAAISGASPSSQTPVFTEIQEIYDPRRGWIVAPPPTENVNGRHTKGRAFVVHFREAPSGKSAENSIWLEIESEAFLDKLREHFPITVGLYDNKPGVSTRFRLLPCSLILSGFLCRSMAERYI